MKDFFVLSMMKNEEDILEEWIEHYKLFGVTKIFILDDESTDNSVAICQKYSGFVEVKTIQGLPERTGRQTMAYNTFFSHFKKYNNFALICDIDEFVFPLKAKSLSDYCEEKSNFDKIKIQVLDFGANDNIKQPKSIVASCVYRNYFREYVPVKCVVKLNKTKKFHIHYSEVRGETISPSIEEIRLNHYILQSKEHMIKRFTRGGGDRGAFRPKFTLEEATKMTDEFFENRRHSIVFDDTLPKLYDKMGKKVNQLTYCVKKFGIV